MTEDRSVEVFVEAVLAELPKDARYVSLEDHARAYAVAMLKMFQYRDERGHERMMEMLSAMAAANPVKPEGF